MSKFVIGEEFSPDPSGRYYTDGEASGERFREEYLKKKIESLNEGEKLEIVIDGKVEGYGSSFLVEGFAGMVKHGYITSSDLLNKIEITYEDEEFSFFKDKIERYIKEAVFNSQEYIRSK